MENNKFSFDGIGSEGMLIREEFYMESVDKVHMIHGFRWYHTDKKFKGVLQIVHGMIEYVERYDEFAKYMAEQGYFVIGHDHLGHGDSVKNENELGYVGKQGAALWLKDMEQVRKMAVSYAPKVPYIMLGHSMGSFLVRRYLIYCGNRIDGAIIMGTGQQQPALLKVALFYTYLAMIRYGKKGHSRFLDNMTCVGYAKKYKNNEENGSWISRDPQELLIALKDKKRNFRFSLNAYEALFRTIEEVIDEKRVAKMPKDLPILILSGTDDLVGECGKGVLRFEYMLKKIGMKQISSILYPENRHELLCDLDKEQVFKDIKKWSDSITKK